jgi:hypothetical protein
MARVLAGGDLGGTIMDREAIGVAGPSSLGAPAALVFGAGQVMAPSPVIGAFELGIDEAIDGLVADDLAPSLAGEAAGDLLG